MNHNKSSFYFLVSIKEGLHKINSGHILRKERQHWEISVFGLTTTKHTPLSVLDFSDRIPWKMLAILLLLGFCFVVQMFEILLFQVGVDRVLA